MNSTEQKIISRMLCEMETTQDAMKAAWNVCQGIKAEAAEKWGAERAETAFNATATFLAECMGRAVTEAQESFAG